MITELRPFIGIGYDGREVEHDQWFVTVDGVNLGLLCKKPDSTIMPLMAGNKLTDDQWLPIVAECATIAGHVVNAPFHFYVPPEEELEQQSDEEESDEEEDDS